MTVNLLEMFARLSEVKKFDYFKNRAMPEFVEPLITNLVTAFSSSPESEQRELLSAMHTEASNVLGWYARKLAGQAVRNRSREDLWNGLVALSISSSNADFRDCISVLALLYHSALKLGENPEALFEMALKLTLQAPKTLFNVFLNRPVAQRSIKTFDFSEGVGPHGFDYVPLLAEYGGPTPFDRTHRKNPKL